MNKIKISIKGNMFFLAQYRKKLLLVLTCIGFFIMLSSIFVLIKFTLDVKKQNYFIRNYMAEACIDGDELYRKKCECVFYNFGVTNDDFDSVIEKCAN